MDPTPQSGYSPTSGSSTVRPEGTTPNTTSTTFGPGNVFGGMSPDMVITSSDRVAYYVHRPRLSHISSNAFAGMLPNTAFSVSVSEPATVLDIVIHTVYSRSCADHKPSLDDIEAALDALVKYGVDPRQHAARSQPLYGLLLLHAPSLPIDAYALAGKSGFEDAAVAISAYLLAFDLTRITEAHSIKMGALCLQRLVELHRDRANALRSIVIRPPASHPPVPGLMCDERSRAQLTLAWAFATAGLAWVQLPGMSTDTLRATFEKAGEEITCEDCQTTLQARIQEVCSEWSDVKGTI